MNLRATDLAAVVVAAVEFAQASMERADVEKLIDGRVRLNDPALDGQVAQWMALGETVRLALIDYRAACEQVTE